MYLRDVFETLSASLYHGTNFYAALQVIKTNTILDKTPHQFPSGPMNGVSLTRSRRFAMHWGDIIFELDRNRLAQRHRLIPFNYWHRGTERSQSDAREEAEEFIIGSIAPADRYIMAIYIRAKSLRFLQQRNDDSHGAYETLLRHPLLQTVDAVP